MQKAYERVNWGNHSTPINEDNLNKMDDGIDKLDDRIVTLDSTKLDKTSANRLLSGMDIDDENSNIVLRYYGGGTQTIHTEIAGMAATAREAAEQAKEYAEQALSTTPGGYNQMVSDVDLLKNSIIRTTDRTLYGSKAGGIKLIGVKGASEQKQYSGKNLFDGGDLSFTASHRHTFPTPLQTGTYTISAIVTSSDTDNTTSNIIMRGEGGAILFYVDFARNSHNSKTITLSEPCHSMSVLASNTVTNSDGDTATWKDIMIERGSIATDYEPYVGNAPSPSPDYPQSVESVGDLKNLLPPIIASGGNGVTLSYDKDGYMVLNGTATATSVFSQYFDSDLPIGTYTLSANNEKKASATIQCTISDSNLSVDIIRVNLNDVATTITKTTTEVGKRWAIIIPSGTVLENYRLRPQLEGGEISTPYRPYGEYGLKIKQEGKNLLKGEVVKNANAVFDKSTGTITSVSTTNTVNSTVKVQTYLNGARVRDVQSNMTIERMVVPILKDSSFNQLDIGFNGNKQDQMVLLDCSNLVDGNTYYIHMRQGESKPNGGIISGIMITTQEEFDGDYEPYHSNTITIPLSEPLREGDEIAVVDGVWGVNRNTASVIFDGSDNEGWGYNADYVRFHAVLPKITTTFDSSDSLCTHVLYNVSTFYDGNRERGFCTNGRDLWLRLGESEITTLDGWKAWLAENNPVLEYKLTTPTFEPFADQTPFYGMKSYDTVTYISTDSKVEPSIEVKFGKTEGDAITLGNYNRTKLNEIRISELMAMQTELATALVAGSEV